MILSREDIEKGLYKGLGLKASQAKVLGLRYPVKKGWKNKLVGTEISEELYARYIELGKEKAEIKCNTSKKQKKNATERFKRNFLDVNSNYCKAKTTERKLDKIKIADLKYDRKEIIKTIKKMPYQEFLKSPYWKTIATFIKTSNKGCCFLCGKKSKLDVHHTTYKNHGNEINNIEDLIPLCRVCHKKVHNLI
jgi:hypothetical protein